VKKFRYYQWYFPLSPWWFHSLWWNQNNELYHFMWWVPFYISTLNRCFSDSVLICALTVGLFRVMKLFIVRGTYGCSYFGAIPWWHSCRLEQLPVPPTLELFRTEMTLLQVSLLTGAPTLELFRSEMTLLQVSLLMGVLTLELFRSETTLLQVCLLMVVLTLELFRYENGSEIRA
jgi:hypothetical protein